MTKILKQILLSLCLFLSSCCCSEKILTAANAGNATTAAATAAATLTQIFTEYFRFYGVSSVILIVCPEDLDAPAKRKELLALTQELNEDDFYVRIFKGPPLTFQSANNTRRPFNLKLKPLTHKSGIIVMQFSTACALNVLRWSAASDNNYFTTNRFWLLLTDVVEHLQLLTDADIFLPPDSEVRVMLQPATSKHFTLIDVYKVDAGKALKQHTVGRNLQHVAEMLKALQQFGSAIAHRQNLEGITFNTGLVIAFPDIFTNIEDLSMRHIDTISKVNNRLTLELANKLNFSFNTHQTDNYGWHQPNGSFDGLMGRFQRYELDFAQNAIFMRLDRIAICDFVAETFRVRAGIMFRQPPLSAVANIFAMPFSTSVWISILLLMILTLCVLSIELRFSSHAHQMDFWDCLIFIWGAMCQQGFYVAITNRTLRMIAFSTFLATLFLYTSFSANIVALLQSPSEAIHTLSDLSLSPLEIGVQDTVYNKIYFNESTDPVTNRLYHKKIATKGDKVFMRPLVGMAKMRTELFAYQVELQAGYQIISDTFSEPEKCGLMELEPFQLPMIAIPTRKNFPYKELFRRQLRWQREVSLMNREERKWFPQKPKCEGGVGGFVSIGITECRYALSMYGCGMLLGVLMFVFELMLKCSVKLILKCKLEREQNSRNQT